MRKVIPTNQQRIVSQLFYPSAPARKHSRWKELKPRTALLHVWQLGRILKCVQLLFVPFILFSTCHQLNTSPCLAKLRVYAPLLSSSLSGRHFACREKMPARVSQDLTLKMTCPSFPTQKDNHRFQTTAPKQSALTLNQLPFPILSESS